MRTRHRPLVLLAVLCLAFGLSACGGDDDTDDAGTTAGATTDTTGGDTTTTDGGAAEQATVVLIDFEIQAPGSAPAGTTFTVTNDGQVPHNWTAGDGTFATDDLEAGDQATVTIDEPGTYDYTCTIHPDLMTGTIEITEA